MTRSALFGALIVPLVLACAALAADDWPQFRGIGGAATAKGKAVPTTWSASDNIIWKTPLPGPGTSSPIVIDEDLYLTCYSGAASGEEGKEKLKLHVVRVDHGGEIEWVRDVEAKLPEQERIREGHGYASSTPAADAERVYVFFGKTGALAFDHNGNQLWQTEVGSKLSGWGSATSPVLYGDVVIVNASVESDSLVALNQKTGKKVWTTGGVREAWNTPILVPVADGKTELVVAVPQKLLGFDPEDGKQLWSCKTDIQSYMAPSLVAHDGVVYSVGGRSNGSLAVRAGGRGDVTESHRLWTGKKGSNVTSPIVHDGHVYWMNDNSGIAYCADAKTGEIVYEERPRPPIGQVYSSPVLVDGKIYYTGRGGKTFVVAAAPKYEVLAVNEPLERGVYNASPAVADGRLYLRTDKHLYCIGTQ